MMVRFQTGFAAQYRARRGSTLMTCRVYPPSPPPPPRARQCGVLSPVLGGDVPVYLLGSARR